MTSTNNLKTYRTVSANLERTEFEKLDMICQRLGVKRGSIVLKLVRKFIRENEDSQHDVYDKAFKSIGEPNG